MNADQILAEIDKLTPAEAARLKRQLARKPNPRTSVPARRIQIQEPPNNLTRKFKVKC